MKTYVAVYSNDAGQKMAGMDDSSGGYSFPSNQISSVKFWNNLNKLKDYLKTINYGKDKNDLMYLVPAEFKFTVKLLDI